jgi:hypothetical protein
MPKLYIQNSKKILQVSQIILAAILLVSIGQYHKSNNFPAQESNGISLGKALLTSEVISTNDQRNSVPVKKELPSTTRDCEEREFEDDKNEKDDSLQLNSDHNKLPTASNAVALTRYSRKTGSSLPVPLYVLHHSWKHFLS